MYNPDTDLIFPPRCIPSLFNERGATWQKLVKIVVETGLDSHEQMAFILMMARLNNCATCNADSYRSIHGCTICAKQSLKRFHGSDEELTGLYQSAISEVVEYIEKNISKTVPINGTNLVL